MVQPWAAAGFECFCVDTRHPQGETPAGQYHFHRGRSARMASAAAPLRRRLRLSTLHPHRAARGWCGWSYTRTSERHTVSTLGSYWREPDFTFYPHQFGGWPGGEGDDYSKRTCWTGGGFRLPQQRPIPEFRPLYMHNQPPSDERGDLRSIFARAVFEANLGCASKGRA
jgi:hypothetical protein